jgi:GNAT superfamily N-acetyltransferase
MTSLEIRAARESDTPELFTLVRAKAEFDGCLELLRADESSLAAALFAPPPKAKALVAAVDSAVVGLITYYDIYSSFIAKPGIWLDDLYVHESHRGQGIGRALLTKLCQIAQETGCGRIDWIVARDNVNGRAFYRSLGAQVFEQVRHARLDAAAIDLLAAKSAERMQRARCYSAWV